MAEALQLRGDERVLEVGSGSGYAGRCWEQLPEVGRFLYPRGSAGDIQELVLVTKTREGPREKRLAPVRFVPMRRPR